MPAPPMTSFPNVIAKFQPVSLSHARADPSRNSIVCSGESWTAHHIHRLISGKEDSIATRIDSRWRG